jgi:cytochrome o ubiquinol oxidase subunit 2
MKKALKLIVGALVAIIFVILAGMLLKSGHYDVLQPHGHIAVQQRNLLYFTLGLSAIVVLPVFTMLGLFAWKYREGRGKRQAHYTPEWASDKMLETIWWGIPIAIISVLAVVAIYTSHSLDPYKKISSNNKTLEVQVVALQWKWLFIYPELGIATVNQLPVPVNTPIHFTLTSDAPMSAFWVPTLGTQIYAMSGMSSQLNLIADTTGDFPGYTTNINGAGYADMKFLVHSKSQKDFDTWVAQAKQSPRTLDKNEYAELIKPSTIKEERAYVLGQQDLYDRVILKYMSPEQPASQEQTVKDQPHSMHDMSTMEGM